MSKKYEAKEDMKDRVFALATMGYLAAIFYQQGEDDDALQTLAEISKYLEHDLEIAHTLNPLLTRVGEMIGFDVVFEAPKKETPKKDRGMH